MKAIQYKGYRIYNARSGSNLRLLSVKAKRPDADHASFSCVYGSPVSGREPLTQAEALAYVKAEIDAALQTAETPKPSAVPPCVQWDDLKQDFLDRINQIDGETPWSESEPSWWLEMQQIARAIRNTFYVVEGNHPTLKRLDERVPSHRAALARKTELTKIGYEVNIIPASNHAS